MIIIRISNDYRNRRHPLDYTLLETFVTLAEEKNFTRAAAKLNIVQSTVSNRMASLEAYLGVTLVIRSKRAIELTQEGLVFLRHAKTLCATTKQALQELHSYKRFQDQLNIGSVHWIYHQWATPLVHRYIEQNPDISVSITIARNEELLPRLQSQELDFCFLSYEIHGEHIESIPFQTSEVVCVAAPSFSSLQEGIDTQTLLSQPLIYSDVWTNYLSDIAGAHIPDGKTFNTHCNLLSVARDLAISGAGCCILPLSMVEQDLANGVLIQIPLHSAHLHPAHSYVAYNTQRYQSEAVKRWLQQTQLTL